MCAIADMDQDGVQEVLWGERCIELNAGKELFCADLQVYQGHSDIAQPLLDRATGRWFVYTCRESDPDTSPRVALFDDQGSRVWGAVDQGHIDMGWAARLGDGGRLIASAIRIGHKTCGPDGRFHTGMNEFAFDALTGAAIDLTFSTYGAVPVDLNGDAYHELVRGRANRDGEILDRHGTVVGHIGAPTAMASKFLDLPGEQLLAYYPDGTLRVWADRHAEDTEQALVRYAHPLYIANQRLTGVGYNLLNLGGI